MLDSDKTNILIVDDLPEKLLAYGTLLEELGQNLIVASSGPEALRQVLRHDFAVILLDVNMPGMDGFETAQLIRKRKRSSHTPIIFLTAFADEVQTTLGYATGGVDYIATPVVPEILRAKVRVFVELYRMRQQVAFQAEMQAKRQAAEESAQRSSFLAEASRSMASSLDLEATLRVLARLAVPEIADMSLVTLADEHREFGRSELAWLDPMRATISPAGDVNLVPQAWVGDAIRRVLASGKLELHAKIDPPKPLLEPLQSGSNGPTSTTFENFPIQSLAVLPLMGQSKTLGTLILALKPPGRYLTEKDLSLAVELSDRAGVALANALLVRDIKESDKRKNEFLAMLSHELRNPLAPVRNAVQVLLQSGIDHPQVNWAREVIDRQVSHLARLVDDLLDVSRITRGKIRLQLKVCDVAGLVASAIETSRPAIEANSHNLLVLLPKAPLHIMADPARLAQVLANLLNNAAKYTPPGGHVAISAEKEGPSIVFRVKDSGSGIPSDMLVKIFDLFTQVDNSLDRSQGGLGIGLTLVKRLIEMHGGSVQAFSGGVGKGSEFVVRLPAASCESRIDETKVEANGMPAVPSGRRVLVVDDNIDSADSLAMLLRLSGYDVRLAYDGPTAIVSARDFAPEIVLLDIGLPSMNGYEVARHLRTQPATEEILLVAVSGYGQDEDRQQALQAGFNHHLTKPIDYLALEKILASFSRKMSLKSAHGK